MQNDKIIQSINQIDTIQSQIQEINTNLSGATNLSYITLSTKGNYTLKINSLYDISSVNVKDSVLTLPVGTSTKQTIEVLVSVAGFDQDNYFSIVGNINGVDNNTITIKGSFVDYQFIWSNTSKTWVSPLTVIK